MLEKGEVLLLDDNKEYAVVSTCKFENDDYVCVTEVENPSVIMFCKYENETDDLLEVIDELLIEKLMLLFKDDIVNKKAD